MRYWAFFLSKLVAAVSLSYGGFVALQRLWPGEWFFGRLYPPRFVSDLPYTLAVGLWFLLSWGLVYLCVWDQRYRCRVCLRKLRMPIEIGSWSRMLQLGRPEIEYICTYGHGKLSVAEVQIWGTEQPEWTPHPDMWEELAGVGKKSDPKDFGDD